MDYDLTRLGSREFEHLTQALCSAAFGPKVQVFGDGPDGGRDAAIKGSIDWDNVGDGGQPDRWTGYTVVQAKFRQRPGDPSSNLHWLLEELRKELSAWKARLKRGAEKPDYLLIATNVVLSPGASAGIDSADRLIAELVDQSALSLRGWRLWHYDTLRVLLDVHQYVRFTYGGFLTTGDVLARMHEWLTTGNVRAEVEELLGREQTKLGNVLTMHATKDMLAQQYVRLGQAGDLNDDKLALHQIGIDLPARYTLFGQGGRITRGTNAAKYIIEQGERVPGTKNQVGQPHILLIGGPGQGKSTLSQLICQRYRIALLRDAPLSAEARRLLDQLGSHFDSIGLAAPIQLRWPIRVVLSEYRNYVMDNNNNSLMRFLAEKVSSMSSFDVTGAEMQEWLISWPWLLVLDGMDEVVTPIAREKVSSGISDFLVEAAHAKANLLLVVTTRPQGYLGEFGTEDYRQVSLRDLETAEALSYARKLTAVRLGDDPDMQRQVDSRLSSATKASETSRLMRTPLQVTIMTLLLERRQRVPSDRYQLFNAYFDTIYAREMNKPTELGKFLEDYRADIEAIHEMVALELQQQAESMAEHESSLPAADLGRHAFDRLQREGNDDETALMLSQKTMKAATQRLVLLVPRGDNGVGFEIRSLQEYLAARALTRAEGPEVLRDLRALIPSAHWRNTWLFAAGRLFAERERLREQLISMLEQFDNDNLLSWLVRAGAQLATDLLTDDLAIRSPQYRQLLADQALDRLNSLPDATSPNLATLLIRLAREDRLIRQKVDHLVATLLTTDGGTHAHAKLILDSFRTQHSEYGYTTLAAFDKDDGATRIEDYGLKVVLDGPQAVERVRLGQGPKLITYLTQYLPELTPEDNAAIMRLLNALPDVNLRTIRIRAPGPPALLMLKPTPVTDHQLLQEVFGRPSVAEAYTSLITSLPPPHWQVAAYLRDIARTWYARRVTGKNA
jgi:hypothetical protein